MQAGVDEPAKDAETSVATTAADPVGECADAGRWHAEARRVTDGWPQPMPAT